MVHSPAMLDDGWTKPMPAEQTKSAETTSHVRAFLMSVPFFSRERQDTTRRLLQRGSDPASTSVLGDPCLDQFPDQRRRERLVRLKPDAALAGLVVLQILPARPHD